MSARSKNRDAVAGDMRSAKIVCTIGPASSDRSIIEAMVAAGMAVARLNASHGTVEQRREILETIESVSDDSSQPIATMLDLRGPEIRTAAVDTSVSLTEGDEVELVTDSVLTDDRIGVSVDLSSLTIDTEVLFDDGLLTMTIVGHGESGPIAKVESGGVLSGSTGVNVPGVMLDVEMVTEADEAELDLAAEMGVDFVAASFVADRHDVLAVSEALEYRGVEIPIIAKIELGAALKNIDEIIDASYGVMVARGDLGVECPLEEVPIIQKQLIRRCRQAGVPVITATEMLDSMITAARPTRAEASDVANAVLDGTDAVMLSGETAMGDRPIAVVETMATIIETAEASDEYGDLREQRVPPTDGTNTDALARSARYLARDLDASAIVVASESGFTALKATKFRPGVPIVAITPNPRVHRRLALSWGVDPHSGSLRGDDVINSAVDAAVESPVIEGGDTLVVLSGVMTDIERETANTLRVHIASERIGVGAGVVSGDIAGPLLYSDDGDLEGIEHGTILYLDQHFAGELNGPFERLGGIIHERPGMTGYAAVIARELGVPMASGVTIPDSVKDGDIVTLYGDRGVIYLGDVLAQRTVENQ